MFSSRTHWNTALNQISALAAEKRLLGESIVDLTESNPTLCGFKYPNKEILSALSNKSALVYQPEPRGLTSARRAIAEYYAALNISVSPEHIVLTASTSEAYSFLFKLICNVGDEVLIPRPSYPLFEYLCQLNDTTLKHYRLLYDGEWHIDFASLLAGFNDRTRAIILVHPNNPTGSYLKEEEFNRVCSLAVEHRCAIIVDEVFGAYAFSSDARRATILGAQSPVQIFSLNGISKLLGLPQLKLSWIVIGDNKQYTSEALNRLDIIADTFLSVNTPSQVALPMLLQKSITTKEHICKRTQTNYQLLKKVFTGTSVSVFQVEGGWYAVLQLPQTCSDDDWASAFLASQNILVYPGHFFDIERPSCIVVSLLPVSSIFEDAILRIQQFVEEKAPF